MGRSLQTENLNRRIARLESLPTLPAVAVELVRCWNDPDLSLRSITEILSHDPSLAAKVLEVANSATLGLKKKVTSLNHASALLGLNTLRCVTLGVTVFQSFADRKAEWCKKMDLDEFWRHSLAVAVAAEMLAVRFGWATPEEAFLAGLLHDIGKIGLLATVPETYVEVVEQASAGMKSLVEYESENLPVTHTEVGKWIAERWGFPDILRDAVWLHHNPPSPGPVHPKELGKLIYLADHLARRARIGEAGNRCFLHDDEWLQDRVGLAVGDLDHITANLLERVQSIGTQLNLEVPTISVYLKALQEANQNLSKSGVETVREQQSTLKQMEILGTISKIAQLPVHEELEVDLLAQAADLIRLQFDLTWILIITRDPSLNCLEGVLFRSGMPKPQTFYRTLGPNEHGEESGQKSGRRGFLDLLGETVLSSGKRINLRDEVLRVLESGQLAAIPLELDSNYRGECLVDTFRSKILDAEVRRGLDICVEATANMQDRARLFRNFQRESESSAHASRREAEAQRQLFHMERLASVGRLAAGAAHEINNPLAVISGKAQLLLMEEKDQKRSKTLTDIVGQSERISKIISDLMGFARPTQPTVKDSQLAHLIENALQMARHRMPRSAVSAEVDIPEDMPPLRVDDKQIEQVFVNLFVNAMQAMGDRGGLTIRAAFIKSSNMAAIQVIDSGPGIPGPDLAKIFDPFFTTKREGEGTGLGLAVSQRIIQTHGGSIWVNSHQGKGTTFTVQLPCGQPGELAPPVRPSPVLEARLPTRKRILLVDDEKPLSDLMHDFLTNAGYLVEQASDGEEAMQVMAVRVFDALIIDIRMPRKDGLEVLEELQATTPGIPTLVVTGLATNEELDQAVAFGAGRVLRKPFQLDDLLRSVREMLRET